MKNPDWSLSRSVARKLFTLGLITAMILASTSVLQADDKDRRDNFYKVTNLVSDALPAAHTDPDLVNSWGIAFNPNGFVWIADNGTGVATLYDGDGNKQTLIVTIPPPAGGTTSAPTGIVFNNSSTDFNVSNNGKSGVSVFIFATEDGTISGWAPTVDQTHAILAVDNSSTGAVYKGLALAGNGNEHFLYATDFHNGKIDVFDSNFAPRTLSSSFSDPSIPSGYAPFGIRNINGNLYVTYAKQDQDKHDDVPGLGHGFINIFDPNGNLIDHFASRGFLNSPWGLALAPAGFGRFANHLLIGNFGDGFINAFDLATGIFLGQLRTEDGRRFLIDGLWGLDFGNGVQDFPTNTLFFTAGPNGEQNGLFGKIEVASRPH